MIVQNVRYFNVILNDNWKNDEIGLIKYHREYQEAMQMLMSTNDSSSHDLLGFFRMAFSM